MQTAAQWSMSASRVDAAGIIALQTWLQTKGLQRGSARRCATAMCNAGLNVHAVRFFPGGTVYACLCACGATRLEAREVVGPWVKAPHGARFSACTAPAALAHREQNPVAVPGQHLAVLAQRCRAFFVPQAAEHCGVIAGRGQQLRSGAGRIIWHAVPGEPRLQSAFFAHGLQSNSVLG